jgi:hypothetical protein
MTGAPGLLDQVNQHFLDDRGPAATEGLTTLAQTATCQRRRSRSARSAPARTQAAQGCQADQNGGYLESVSKNTADQGVCGGDMSLPNGTCETRNVKSGSEKGIDAGHVGDITSGAAETPL